MKLISRLLILCMLLSGCAKPEAVVPVVAPSNETVVPPGLYQPGSSLEISSSGVLQVYPLENPTGKAILPLGENLLLLSGEETTTLTVLTGDILVPEFRKQLSFCLEARDCMVHPEGLSYFDPTSQELVLLDHQLEELRRIQAPKAMLGAPLLSPEGNVLYYCTERDIRAWDLSSDIHRILRQTAPSQQTLSGLYSQGQVLRCQRPEDESFFLSTDTGALLSQEDSPLKLAASSWGFAAATWETNLWSLVFRLEGGPQLALTPRELSAEYFLLENQPAVLTAALAGEALTLDYYDLTTGQRQASQMLRGGMPLSAASQGADLYILLSLPEGLSILRWDTTASLAEDPKIYAGPHYTAKQPDREGLQQCQAYARELGQQYGLEILLWEAAVQQAPEGCILTPEHRVNILNRELELLDHRLAQFPEGMLSATTGNFSRFTLCLVSKISGSIRSQSLQYFDDDQACIVLAVGSTSEQALYHELFHGMETHILSHSSAFDQWNALNPQGFLYDYDYAANAIRNSGIYLTDKNRSFIDTFSMSYPKEDRARVFETAMMPGQESLFTTKAMQKKLAAVCSGIREAYGLTDTTPYPWEQYLY